MAQKEIAIKLGFTSTGEQKVIKNLGQLESELANLQAQLKTLDFGTPAFIEATQNIAKLRSAIDDVDKATEGIGAEKRFRAIGDAVNILTGSFQVLSGALGLIITDTEDLEQVQAAEAKALQVLNVALGINAINTALVESATLRATIATRANAIATGIAAKATAAWTIIINLNPIAAFAAGVVALTAAIYGLVKAYDALFGEEAKQEEILKATEKLERELIKTRTDASKELETQLKILTDNVKTRNLELRTLEQLKKVYPGLNAFIDKNNKLTADGVKFLKLQIQLRQQEAALAIITQKRVEKEIEFETEAAELRAEYGASAPQLIAELKESYNEDFAPIIALQDKYTNAIDKTLGKLAPYENQLKKQVKIEEAQAKSSEKNVEVVDKVLRQYELRINGLKNLIDQLQKAQSAELKYTAGIIENQEKAIQEQESFLETQATTLRTEGEKVLLELRDFLLKTIPSAEEAKKLSDGYADLFNTIRFAFNSGELDFKKATGWDEFVKFAEMKLPEIGESLTNVNEESRRSFVQYFNSLDQRVSKISETIGKGNFENLFGGVATKELLNQLVDAEIEIGKLRADSVKLGLTEQDIQQKSLDIVSKRFGIDEKVKKLFAERGKLQIDLDAAERSNNTKAATTLKNRIDAIDTLTTNYKLLTQSILDGVIRTDDFVKGLESVEDQSEKNLQTIEKNKRAIQEAYDPRALFEFGKAQSENLDIILLDIIQNTEKYLNQLGQDGIEAFISGLEQGLPDLENATKDELRSLIGTLETLGSEIQTALGLAVNPFQDAIDKAKKSLETLPSDFAEDFQDFFTDLDKMISNIVSKFQTLTSGLAQVLQSRNSLVLEQLARDEEQTIERIGSASARALKEQEDARREFAKRRFEIEKKARIQELNFTLAQTIAEGAQAVVNALASVPFPGSIPYATLIGGLAVAQTQAVSNQLTAVKAQQFVGRRGGLIMGESHEGMNGGVPALLEGGEFVVNKAAVARYGDLIGDLNSSTGGRKLTIDDSRLVQAIAKQNTNTPPIKTYVLYNDIQNTEKLNNRITQLSRL